MKKQLWFAARIGFACALFGLSNPQRVSAQLQLTGTNYIQHFDSLINGLPEGWSVDTGMTSTYSGYNVSDSLFLKTPATNTGWSNTTGKFKNVASGIAYNYFTEATSSSQLAQTNRALGLRQNAAIDKNVGFILKIANTTGFNNFMLSFNLQSLDSNAIRVSTWQVDYATGNNPTSFTTVPATGIMTTGGNQFSKNDIVVNFGNALDNKSGPVYIRIVSLMPTTGSNSRATSAIDNYNLSWNVVGPATNIEITNKTPTGINVPVSTNQLKIKFDSPIQAESGHIDLYKTGNSVPVIFPIPSSSVIVSDSTATINGINLENNTSYYVLMAAGTFRKPGTTLTNQAITDTTFWIFSTADTSQPQQPIPATSLNETFTNCMDTTLSGFIQYNNGGVKKWQCATSGHTDNASVLMNGGLAAGASDSNEDWLISSKPLHFVAMTNPTLGFWQKRRFEGNVTRTVKISTNYMAGTNPANAAWTTLQVQDMSVAPSVDIWSEVKNINLTAFKNTPFHLAFTYSCSTNGAYELSYDDIKVEDKPLGISAFPKSNFSMKLLGEATSDKILVGIELLKDADLNIQMYDLTGRTVYRNNIKGKAGHQNILLENTSFPAGTYILRIWNENNFEAIKITVR